MKVIEDVKKRMKSNGVGRGSGLRRGMVNVVQRSSSSLSVGGILPLRAKSLFGLMCKLTWQLTSLYIPGPSCPSSKNPSIDLG